MKYFIYLFIIILLLIISRSVESFEDIDTGIGIGPWWAQGPGLKRGFQRCSCDSYRNCSCLDGSAFHKNIAFPQYYFNYL
jgi:hypothetical protein